MSFTRNADRSWNRRRNRQRKSAARRRVFGGAFRRRFGIAELLEDRRLLAAGALDETFNPAFDVDGKVTTAILSGEDTAYAVAIQPDGKTVAAGVSHNGSNLDFALVRYNLDGSLDTTFDGDGKLTTAILSGHDVARAIAIQADGKIVVAGYSANGSNYDFALARYNADGSLGTSFDSDGKVTTAIFSGDDHARAIAIQSDGKIVVAGDTYNGSDYDFALVRYNTDGSLDTSFDSDGIATTGILSSDDRALAMALPGPPYPAATILPSGCITTSLALSSPPEKGMVAMPGMSNPGLKVTSRPPPGIA